MSGEAPACPASGGEEEPRPSADRLRSGERDQLDLRRRAKVRPPARIEVEALDLHETDLPFVSFRQAASPDGEPGELLRRDPARRDGASRPDLRRDGLLEGPEPIRSEARSGQLDVAETLAEVEGRRLPAESILGHGRQEVLPRVLLHVIEAARPVEAKCRRAPGHGAFEEVPDPVRRLLDVEDGDAREESPIGRLAAPFGIEDRVGEDGEGAAVLLARCEDLGIEVRPVRVALVGGEGMA